jgi:D-serine deaminase-like pyridoxal phosphate-dependent protein
MTAADDWMRIANEDEVPSPALLIHPDRVAENLRRMAVRAGGAGRLRPHVKTHKLPQIVALELSLGVVKFKASTIAEAEMCATAGAADILLAYQPAGPNARRLVELARKFPQTRFSTLVDNAATLAALGSAAQAGGVVLDVFLDLNVGMNRTGIAPGPDAAGLYRALSRTPGLRAAGLHAYDGHLHNTIHAELARDAAAAFAPVWKLREELIAAGLPVPTVVAGGSPTFSVHAGQAGVELGAGTTVLWDVNDAQRCPDLDFLHAATVMTRVVSRPLANRLCLDLGHKAVASEMPHPRVRLAGLEDAAFVMHSEEHLVIETPRAGDYPVGTVIYGIPSHICPTVALYSEVCVVRGGRAAETWPVVARARRLTL